jgi:transposase
MKITPTTSCHAGIDWSWQHHALCIVDDDGQRIDEATVPHTRPGLAKITTLLRRHGVDRVGIERGDGPVVEHLLRDGFEVVVISARQVKSLRARYGSAGNKDDRFDAFVLADALRTDAGRWAIVQPDSDETIALRMLVRARQDLIGHRIAVHNQLLAVLQHNFPGAIGAASRPKPRQHGCPSCEWPTGLRPTATAAVTPRPSSLTTSTTRQPDVSPAQPPRLAS